MRIWILGALLMFAGAALMGSPAFACGCCKKAVVKTDKKEVEKPAEKKVVVVDKKEGVKAEEKKVEKSGDIYVVVVTEMCCNGCAKSVVAKFKKMDGVASVTVDLETGKVTITMKEGKNVDKTACEKALKGTDFGVTSCDKQEAKVEVKKEEPTKEEPAKKEEAATPKKGYEGCGSKKASN